MEADVERGGVRNGRGRGRIAWRAGVVVIVAAGIAGAGGGGVGPPWGTYATGSRHAHGAQPVSPPAPAGPAKEEEKEGVEQTQPPVSAGLDELLGLDPREAPDRGDAGQGGGDGAGDVSSLDPEQRRALERQLAQGQMAEGFKAAVELMNDAADRVEGRRGAADAAATPDVGLGTQRLQEEALRNLDTAIQSLQKMQQNSTPSQRQKQNQSRPQRSSGPEQQQRQGQTPGGDNTDQVDPPGREDGELGGDIRGVRAGWGNLPERMREMLMQGSADSFSATYRTLTQEYFRRLAETSREPRQ